MPTQRFSLAKSLRHERRHRALICLVLVWVGVSDPGNIIILVQAVSPQGRGDSIIGHFSGGFSKKISLKDYLSLCHFQFQNFQRQDSLYLFLFCVSQSHTTPSSCWAYMLASNKNSIFLRLKISAWDLYYQWQLITYLYYWETKTMAVPLTRKDSQ